MKAIAAEMGLKVKIVNATFDSIIPGLAAGKYDVGASSFTDTKEREKTVDFVTYFTAGESFYTKASGGVSISTIADLCGHTVAAEKGTTEQADATTQSAKCKKAGKPGVTVLTFPDQNGANLALVSGRAQIGFADSPVAEYQVQQVQRAVQARRPGIRKCPVRAGGAKEQWPDQADARGGAGPDEERHLHQDPDHVGRSGRRDHKPNNQRSDELN